MDEEDEKKERANVIKRQRPHLIGGDSSTPNRLKPAHMTLKDFATTLYRLMQAKGWWPAELARQADLPRDSISGYLNAKREPSRRSLDKLAAVFDVRPEELYPNVMESAIEEDNPSFEMKVSASDPTMAWMRVNRAVSFATAVKIGELLNADQPLNGS